MDRALFLAMSGAKQNMQAMQLRANNLANVSTTGFRADLAQARSMQAYGEGLPSRVFSMTERPGHNFAQGSVITTAAISISRFKVMAGFLCWIKLAKRD